MAIECKACLTPNRVDARFCEECGSPLTTVCPACSAVVGQDKRFCGDCGSPLTGAADEHGHPRVELDDPLRQATIVALQPSLAEAADGQERHGNMGTSKNFDRLNNVEQVVWENIPAGDAKITVRAFHITLFPQPWAYVWRLS